MTRAACLLPCVLLSVCAAIAQTREPQLPVRSLAAEAFGADAPWYQQNIPFFEIDDPEVQRVYYYRWKLYRSHLREIGQEGTIVTEFLENVPWGRQPFTDLNDSSSFHLLEGRWLRSPAVVDSLIDHLYAGGGNDRHFSEWIASATESTTLVTGDRRPALRNLAAMQRIYNAWDDHFDRARGLYWIEPIADATEYTIASIDASGAGFTDAPSKEQNRNGFTGGWAFRPSINSYQYSNARAIARLAADSGDRAVAADYSSRADAIRTAMLRELWNPALGHFVDRYQRGNEFVPAGEFVRGRELVGFTPWMFEALPVEVAARYAGAWHHALNVHELAGPSGLRTVEPTYAKYMQQYRYDTPTGLRECQWNGPSWPFQTSQALTGLANLLLDYPAAAASAGITASDYWKLLRQYTKQHVLANGKLDLEEDYDPDTGLPIVGLPRSHHYNHSTYIDLLLTGLAGIRPRADDVLEVHPLLPLAGKSVPRSFALERVRYHGHEVGVIWDRDGSKYRIGCGLSVFVDGRLAARHANGSDIKVNLTHLDLPQALPLPVDLAVNVGIPDGPHATASSSISPGGLAEGIDGRMWFFPEIANGWSPAAAGPSWYSVDFGRKRTIASAELYFLGDGTEFAAPASYEVQVRGEDGWQTVAKAHPAPTRPLANGVNRLEFEVVSTRAIRVLFQPPPPGHTAFRLIELKVFGVQPGPAVLHQTN